MMGRWTSAIEQASQDLEMVSIVVEIVRRGHQQWRNLDISGKIIGLELLMLLVPLRCLGFLPALACPHLRLLFPSLAFSLSITVHLHQDAAISNRLLSSC